MKNNITKIVFILALYFFSLGIVYADVTTYNIKGVYVPWDQVTHNGWIYECFEQFKTNQCTFWLLYEPGIGIYWRDTWKFISVTKDNTENIIDFPWAPFIITTPKVTQSWSYIIEWEISHNAIAGKYAKLEENGIIVNTVYSKDNSNIQYGNFYFENMPNGDYDYAVYLCNGSGSIENCTKWNKVLVKVSNSYDKEKVIFTRNNTTTIPKPIKEREIEIIKKVPVNSTNTSMDFRLKIEQKIQTIIQVNKLNKEKIKEIVTRIETKIFILEVKNRKGLLTWAEKRNYFIYKMIKEIFETYL